MTGQDVIVVGASAAGLYAAGQLASRGARVSVTERASSDCRVRRTLIVTPEVRTLLGDDVNPAVLAEVDSYELYADGRVANVALSQPDLVIERSSVVDSLTERALGAGVRLEYERRFAGLNTEHGRCEVVFADGREAADIVVGADGASSAVARAAGWRRLSTVPVVQAIVRRPVDVDASTARVWFRPEDTPYFYWLIPHGADKAAVGLIGDNGRANLDTFLAEKDLVPLEYQAARIPAYDGWMHPHRRIGSSDVYLVGDAAGHVKVSTVGGIHTGFVGARAVTDLIAGGSSRLLRVLRRDLERHRLVRRALGPFDTDDYRDLLRVLGSGSRTLLARHSRDRSRELLWRLALREPRLVLLALRGLLTGQSSAGTRRKNRTRSAPSATSQPMSM